MVRIQSKWIILQLTSLLCYITIFPAIFSAVPIALLRLEAPRNYFLGFLVSSNLILYSYFGFIKVEGIAFAFGYSIICFIGALAAELLLKYYPFEQNYVAGKVFWKNYLLIGIIPLIIAFTLTLSMLKTGLDAQAIKGKALEFSEKLLSEPTTLEAIKELKKSTAPEAENVVRMLENSEVFSNHLLFAVPTYMIMAYFIMLYFTLFFLARLSHFSSNRLNSEWSKVVVSEFRNPDSFIILAILVLAWALFYQQLPLSPFWLENGGILGSSLINIIGVFFFFQGLMVCLHLLDRWGIKGLFGAIILFVILLVAIKAVAILGLIDMWADFRNRKLGFGSKTSEK